jgi:hypothetical protein
MILQQLLTQTIVNELLQVGRNRRLRTEVNIEDVGIIQNIASINAEKVPKEHCFSNPNITYNDKGSSTQRSSHRIARELLTHSLASRYWLCVHNVLQCRVPIAENLLTNRCILR